MTICCALWNVVGRLIRGLDVDVSAPSSFRKRCDSLALQCLYRMSPLFAVLRAASAADIGEKNLSSRASL